MSKGTQLNNLEFLITKLGGGICEPVAYDTAWVARIPQLNDFNEPAFPKSIEWLRNHQLKDGSWGTFRPFYAHGNTLSTLAAIIALKIWNQKEDYNRIENGIKALSFLFDKLSSERHSSIGFEVILPSLLKTASKCGLYLEFNQIEKYDIQREKKLKLIKQYETMNSSQVRQSWWHNLELLEGLDTKIAELKIRDEMIEENECICASPSATAYALINERLIAGKDIPKAFNALKLIYERYNGGIPAVTSIHGFELSFSIGFFIMANMSPDSEILRPVIDKLFNLWIERKGMISSSKSLPPDADVTSVSLFVLKSANKLNGIESTQTLLKFFNGSHMKTYEIELNGSVSTNINSVIALKLFNNESKIKEVIHQIVKWLEKQQLEEDYIFEDKWHLSPYYPISRAIFCLEGIKDSLALKCVNQLIDKQNSDGGWGLDSDSTVEETSYVCLGLSHWLRSGEREDHEQIINILRKAQHFIDKYESVINNELWIDKTLYCPKLVVESVIIAAQYSLNDIFK